jgi:pimeloyl-ACP methyl ester carboxylesterase
MGAAGLADEVRDIALIHGLNSTSQSWSEVIEALPTGIRSVAVDCPPLASVERIAESLIAQLPDRFHLVGYSFGGYVALALLELFPERVASMILIATSTLADTDEQRDFRERAISATRERGYDALSLEQFPRCVHADNRANRDIFYIAHQQACMRRPDRTGVLAGARKPVLLVTPEVDNVVPVRRQLRSLQDIPWAETKSVPGTGHLLLIEAPSVVARIMGDWVCAADRLRPPVS